MPTLAWTDGKLYEVPEERLQQAFADGFRQPTSEDMARAEAADSPIQAGVEAVVRTVIPVVGQEALTAFEEGFTGQSEAEVQAFLVARYGDFVSYRPPWRPATWLLWAGPLLFALAGVVVVRRHARRSAGGPAPVAEEAGS